MVLQAYAVGFDWYNDIAEVTEEVSNGILLSDHYINIASSEGLYWWLSSQTEYSRKSTIVFQYSTLETDNSAYGNLSGTSLASPTVCSTFLLLQQYFYNLNSNLISWKLLF